MIENTKEYIILKLNPKFYELKCVMSAVKDFKKEIPLKLEISKQLIIKVPKNIRNAERYAHEFGNYVLMLMKNKGIV